jgi:hypothetical protein
MNLHPINTCGVINKNHTILQLRLQYFHLFHYHLDTSVVRLTLLYISSEAVIPAKAGIQIENTGFRVKPGMTIKVKGLLTQYTGIQTLPAAFGLLFLPISSVRVDSDPSAHLPINLV